MKVQGKIKPMSKMTAITVYREPKGKLHIPIFISSTRI
jgi:hypothetical protein